MEKNKGIFLFVAMILCVVLIGIITNNNSHTYAQETEIVSENNFQDEYGSSNYFKYNNANYSIYDYSADLYCKNINMIDNAGLGIVEINGDDPIIGMIPKEAFVNEGGHLFIGKEYGYFVYTEPEYCFGIQNIPIKSGHNTVYVLIFDIVNNLDLSDNGVISIRINPLFQYEYKYIISDRSYYVAQHGSGFKLDAPDKNISYRLNCDSGVVIPAGRTDGSKLIYSEIERFYLKDISMGLSVYNEQDYNNINGSLYNAQKDIGSYFTYFDYEYDGKVRRNGEFPTEETITFAKDVIVFALGFVPGANQVVNSIDSIIGYAESGVNFFNTVNGIINFATEQNYQISSGKITATNYFANRDDQLEKYGYLMKTVALAVNSGNESIWYGKGDKCTGFFKLSHSALNGEVPEYTRLYRDLGIKVIDTYGNEFSNISSYYFNLGVPKADEVLENNEVDIVLLPDGINYFHCSPVYSGNYEIKIENVSDYSLYLNGSMIEGNDDIFNVKMEKGKDYYFELKKTGAGAIGKFVCNIGDLKNITLNKDEEYITKIKGDGFYNLNTSNSNVVITKIYNIENGIKKLADISPNVESKIVPVFLSPNEEYYVVLRNTTSDKQSVDLILEEPQQVLLNNEKEVYIDKNGVYFSFTAPQQGSYILSAITDKGIITSFFDEQGKTYTVDSSNNNIRRIDLNIGQKIYMKMLLGNNATDSIILKINETKNAFTWYVNDVRVTNRTLEVKRGGSVIVHCIVNDCIKINQLGVLNDVYYEGYIEIKGDLITVYPDCKIGGNGVDLIAIKNDEGSHFKIIPAFEGSIRISNVVNKNDDIGFSWEKKAYIENVTVYAKIGNSGKDIVCDGGADTKKYIYKSIFSDFKDIISCEDIEISVKYATVKTYSNELVRMHCLSNTLKINCSFYKGAGTSSNPFIINTLRHFNNISRFASYDYYYKVSGVIDFMGTAPKTSTCSFYGDLNGGATARLKNIKIESSADAVGGLFAKNYGKIHNFFEININIDAGSNLVVGGLVTDNFGKIYQNYVNGVITSKGKAAVGGVAGNNMGEINTVPTIVDITSNSRTGGITASNAGIVKQCSYYKSINVNLSDSQINGAGGIVGNNGAGAEVSSCLTADAFSLKYTGAYSDSRTLAPMLGQIVGENLGNVTNCTGNGNIDKGSLHVVTWKEYEFPWWKDRSHDQAKYVGGLIGRTY